MRERKLQLHSRSSQEWQPWSTVWLVSALVLGLVFSVMVHYGFGLLSVTVAHALINFISLRRMVLK